MKILTTSEARCFHECDRKHHYRYELLYRPITTVDELGFGTLIHGGLEAWLVAPCGERLDAALEVFASSECDDLTAVLAIELMRGYDARWGSEPLRALAVEAEYCIPMINPQTGAASKTWMHAGKLDGVVENLHDGTISVIEHKTSSEDIEPGSAYWKLLQVDDQVSNYFEGARALGYQAESCLYDVLGKPKMRPLAATPLDKRTYTKAGKLYANQREEDESLESFAQRLGASIASEPHRWYQRGEVVRSDEERFDAKLDLWDTAKAIQASHLSGRHPRSPHSCRNYHRFCEYFDVCTRTASLEDQTRFVRVEGPHSELECSTQDDRNNGTNTETA